MPFSKKLSQYDGFESKPARHFPAIVDAHPEIPFAQAAGMRNMLSHGYFKVDLEVVWTSIQIDLPAFQSALEALVVSLEQSQEAP